MAYFSQSEPNGIFKELSSVPTLMLKMFVLSNKSTSTTIADKFECVLGENIEFLFLIIFPVWNTLMDAEAMDDMCGMNMDLCLYL